MVSVEGDFTKRCKQQHEGDSDQGKEKCVFTY